MNPFLLDPKARLADWKELRKSLAGLPEDKQLSMTATYWAKAPLAKHAYDIEEPRSIPSAWEMVSEGEWCRTSVAIGMEFTLRLSGWNQDRLHLRLIRDWDVSEMILLLIIDDSRVLNYSYGEVTDYPRSRHDVIGDWCFVDKCYVEKPSALPEIRTMNQ